MSVIIEFTVPSDQFILGNVLQTHPDLRIELDRAVAVGQGPVPFFWISGGFAERFEAELRSDPLVNNVVPLDRVNDKVLYKITWTYEVHEMELPGLLIGITRSMATILKAVGTPVEWQFQLRFENYDSVSDFQSYCSKNGISFHVNRVYTPQEAENLQAGLSNKQYELLSLAISEGYFEIPRRTRLEELAEMVDVASGAASECLRRAQANFFAAHFSK